MHLKTYRVSVKVEELFDGEFMKILSIEETTNNESGILNIIAEQHGKVSDFVDKLLKVI